MNYMIRKPKSEALLGPYSLAEITSQLQSHTITDDYEAHESSGQSFTVLRHSDDWVPVSRLFAPPPIPAESSATKAVKEFSSAERRYQDAYLVASAVTAIGAAVKIIGVIIGLLIILGGAGAVIQGNSVSLLFGSIMLGAVITVPIFVLGVLVSAQAQVLKATLDTAVHSSPFLTKESMAKVMSI